MPTQEQTSSCVVIRTGLDDGGPRPEAGSSHSAGLLIL